MNPSPLLESIEKESPSLQMELQEGVKPRVVSQKLIESKTGILMAVVITGALLQNAVTGRVVQLVFEGLINTFFISVTFALAIILFGFLLTAVQRKMPTLNLHSLLDWVQSFCLLPKYLCFGVLICLPIFDSEITNGPLKYYVKFFLIALLLELPSAMLNLRAFFEKSEILKMNAVDLYEVSKGTIWAVMVYDIVGGFLFTAPSEKLSSLGNILTDVHSVGLGKVISVLSCIILIAALEKFFRPKWG